MDKIRFGGMATGLDTDTLVKQMMQPHRMKVDKQKQDKQVIQWKQDIYRDIINDIRALKNSYLDNIKPDDNLLMQKNYSAYDTSSTVAATATATASIGAVAGNYVVNVVDLAKGAKISGDALTGRTTSSKLSELNPLILADTDISFKLNVNGTDKTITLADVGNKTISEFISAINTQTNGEVNARFSELTQTFSIETNKTGANSSVKILSAGTTADVISAFGIAAGNVDSQKIGSNANLNITPPGGVLIPVTKKETNDFTIDGINYSLKGTGATTLSVTSNTDKTYDKIMGFVTKYNELIDKVKEKVEQKKQYTYTPLTDDQKKDMEPEDIKAWEEKAKEGLIKGDNSLNAMLTSMRSAFFDSVDGVSISLKDLGFTTSRDTSQRGKIVIDESLTAEDAKKKFSDALKNNGTAVADLFCKSGTPYGTKTAYDVKGIFQRLNDTVEEYTKPFGEKGILLKKAGIKGNTTEFNNLLSEQMIQKDKVISELNKKLAVKETNFYAMFARLEKSMNQMNSQSSWLTQQLGGGQ
jgi:flagellar hook-associated protein 2